MKKLLVVMLLLVYSAGVLADIKAIKIMVDGEELDASNLVSLDPLVVDIGIFKDGAHNTYYFRETDNGFQEVYNTLDGLSVVDGDTGDFRMLAGGGNLLMLNHLTTSAGSRGNSVVMQMVGSSFVEYAPDAQTALGGGADSKFYFDWPLVGASGAVYAIGYDNIFPHFLVKITEGNTEILAQESVTDFPGSSEKFSDFGNKLAISPDESMIAFFGMNPSGKSGLFIRTDEGYLTVMDSEDTVPGTDTLISRFPFFRSGIDFKFGADNSLYIQVNDENGPVLLRWMDGNLERFFAVGDELAGVTITHLFMSTLLPLPDGSVLYHARPQLLQFKNDAWSLYFDGAGFTTEDGKKPGVVVNIREDGVYIPFDDSHTSPGEGNISNSILRRGFDDAAFETFYDLPKSIFGGSFRNPHIWLSGERVFFKVWPSIYSGTRADLGSGGGTEPEPSGKGFAAFASLLPPDSNAPDQDADKDGLSNILEYVLGLNPVVADQSSDRIQAGLRTGESLRIDGDSGQYMTISLSVLSSIEDVSVSAVAATSILELAGGGASVVSVGDPIADGDSITYTFRPTFSKDDVQQGFMAFVITLNTQ